MSLIRLFLFFCLFYTNIYLILNVPFNLKNYVYKNNKDSNNT